MFSLKKTDKKLAISSFVVGPHKKTFGSIFWSPYDLEDHAIKAEDIKGTEFSLFVMYDDNQRDDNVFEQTYKKILSRIL